MSPTAPSGQSLAQILIETGVVSEAQVEQARTRQRATGGRLGEALVDLGLATEESIGRALARSLGVPYTNVDLSAVDPAVVVRFPEGLLRRALAMPLIDSGGQIVVAMADPSDRSALAELQKAAQAPIAVVVGAPAAIRRALTEWRGEASESAPAVPAASVPANPSSLSRSASAPPRPAAASGAPRTAAAPPRPAVQPPRPAGVELLLRHLEAARGTRASEIHLVPADAESYGVFYRTDQGLVERDSTPAAAVRALREQLHTLGVPDLARPEDSFAQGSAALSVGDARIQFEATHCRSTAGVATMLRLGPRLDVAPQVSTLGLTPLAEAELTEMCEGPEGIVIVHGPPRTCGTTVLAALTALAARDDRRIVVLEPTSHAPYPPGSTRVRFGSREQAARIWCDIMLGQGADVMVLDGVLHGEAIEALLGGGTIGRLVFARTDWLDGKELLRFLARSRHAPSALRDRPIVLVGLPPGRLEGTSVWSAAEEGGLRPGMLTGTLLSIEDRDALLAQR
ncbi:MAG TPA: ATPase, T2SS/T4P/T4SS family [Candidatus Eisenbacteria bacterium]